MKKNKKLLISVLIILAVISCSIFSIWHIKGKKTSSVASSASSRVVVNTSSEKSNDEDKKVAQKEEQKKEEEKKQEEEKKKEEPKNIEADKTKKSSNEEKKSSNNTDKAEKGKTVYIRVEGYDKTFVPRTQITTDIFDLNPYLGRATGSSATPSNGWGADKFNEPTVAHALVKVLEQNGYKHGTSYDLQDYGWSLYIAMIDGNREFDHRSTSGWMYRVNNVLPNVGCQAKPIKGGEEILWYFGAYGFDTLVTEMSANTTNINAGGSVTVTLNGIKNEVNTWKEYREPAKGATIYVNGNPLKVNGSDVVTDSNGNAAVKFENAGTYKLSAERVDGKGLKDMVRPRPVIINVK